MITIPRIFVCSAILAASTTLAVTADPPVAVDPAEEISQVPPVPATPAAVRKLLYAQPFTLEQGYEFEWRAEHPVVTAGWLLVLEVDPALVFPRQVAEPILYVGSTTAERVNIGHESGRVIAIVPSTLTETGEPLLDLSKALMWFGTPGLPEQASAASIEVERQLAARTGITPLGAEAVAAARAKSPGVLHVAARESLRAAAAELIKTHSPQELELAQSIEAEANQTGVAD